MAAKKLFPVLLALSLLLVANVFPAVAAERNQELTLPAAEVESSKFIAMAVVVGITSTAAAYAVAKVSVAALAAASERPEIIGRSLLFAGLAEGIAIYGLLVAFLIWIT